MITITASTLARAMFTASTYINRGANVSRCITTPGKPGRWVVTLNWSAPVRSEDVQEPTRVTAW